MATAERTVVRPLSVKSVVSTRLPFRTRPAAGDEPRNGFVTQSSAPIVALLGDSTASVVTATAVRLARDLDAPLVFVYVRRGPSTMLGEPYYQRRLSRQLLQARGALEGALRTAAQDGMRASGEILEGRVVARLIDFARNRDARMLVVGQRARFARSVWRRLGDASTVPVVVVNQSRREGRETSALAGAVAPAVRTTPSQVGWTRARR
jgi:nucleotide-binding universal stress UspA family protein